MIKLVTICLLVGLGAVCGFSQDSGPEERYLESDIDQRRLDRGHWADLVSGIDYADKKRPTRPEELPEEPANNNGNGNGNPIFGLGGGAVARFLLIVLGAVAIALLVWSMLGYGRAKDKKIKKKAEQELDIKKIEEHIHEADLDEYIRRAKEAGDYSLAVRLYYLAILKGLSLKKVIKWKVDKTNREYLWETQATNYFTDFQALTFIFEKCWYGDRRPDAGTFAQVEPRFRQFVARLASSTQTPAS